VCIEWIKHKSSMRRLISGNKSEKKAAELPVLRKPPQRLHHALRGSASAWRCSWVGVEQCDKRGFRDLEYAERDVEELTDRLRPAGYEIHLLTSKPRLTSFPPFDPPTAPGHACVKLTVKV
jgi:hypothetical protein